MHKPVSYTHLDVYKRQIVRRRLQAPHPDDCRINETCASRYKAKQILLFKSNSAYIDENVYRKTFSISFAKRHGREQSIPRRTCEEAVTPLPGVCHVQCNIGRHIYVLVQDWLLHVMVPLKGKCLVENKLYYYYYSNFSVLN